MTHASASQLRDFLKTRRSCPVGEMAEPGPDATQLADILEIGARIPDHGKYFPWYFVVFQGEARAEAGKIFRDVFAKQNPDAPVEKLELEEARFMRAPVVIAVVSKIKPGKHAQWEQILSAGAVSYNLCLAANAHGFASVWLSEWVSYDAEVKQALGIDADENIAGFLYLGTRQTPATDRDRPDMAQFVTHWQNGKALNKGSAPADAHIKQGLPKAGFTLPKA